MIIKQNPHQAGFVIILLKFGFSYELPSVLTDGIGLIKKSGL
jgi:hypothetical protein